MQSKLIMQWLSSSRVYNAGVELFGKCCSDTTRLTYFKKGETALRRQLLIDELTKIKNDLQSKEIQQSLPEEVVFKKISQDQEYQNFPDVVLLKVEQVKSIYKSGGAKKAKLLLIADKRERAITAHEIRDGDEKATALLKEIDFFKLHNKLPQTDTILPTVEQMDPSELLRQVLYLRPYISRHKNKPDKAQEIAQKQLLLDAILLKIDADSI